ncbi:MAG: hypothetical protein ACRCYO_13480 [Bacteroidia bacterium]
MEQLKAWQLTEEFGIKLIEDYVFEMKGVRIRVNPPGASHIRQQLFHSAVWTAFEYFHNKKTA